ncbi:MAG: septum formation inhibitor Maf [Bosea sp.]|uniref:Maf family protein n=1 Tax=Bosea sp. (in: a-proteobacteria) TaxID=1871050 RepID=UPI002393EFED|nr:septum formation inhibitor Maf [Bosea sp. (in: a-proteobacteria)]MCP4738826.1 septum formation inhibitor Maf [Bosea sp. (in: a-proteobacteria)]
MTGPATFWRSDAPLILASGSATRRQLLEAAGLPVEVIRPDVDERAIEADYLAMGGSPASVAAALADAKALSVSPSYPGRTVLAADQMLVCEGRPFHKPEDAAAAERQIATLAGRKHELTSAFTLARDGRIIGRGASTAVLAMRPLTPGFIRNYVALAGPAATSSVGGYQLEGLGIHLFETIEGDHSTILGLPMLSLLATLRELDLVA